MKTRTDSTEEETAPTASVEVRGFAGGDETAWEEYVGRHPHGTIFHTLPWRDAIRGTFDHRDKYLVARRGDRITGVLPLVLVSSMFFGTTLISVPFGVYGGILADDEPSARALIDNARALALETKALYVELRHLHAPVDDLPRNSIYHTFIGDVPDTVDGCLERIPRKARAEVRKAIKADELRVDFDSVTVDELHHLFSINKRDLGSPLFPSSLFWHVQERLGKSVHILGVKRLGQTIAAVMSFVYRDTVMPYYSGTLPGAEVHKASNFMYHQLMAWASENGYRHFDFGRSRENTGAFAFKKHQGFEPTRLSYDYVLNTAKAIPSLNPSNPKYRLAKNAFRHMPLWMAQKVGSWLVKRAPF